MSRIVVDFINVGPVDLHPGFWTCKHAQKLPASTADKGCSENTLCWGGFVSKTPRLPSAPGHYPAENCLLSTFTILQKWKQLNWSWLTCCCFLCIGYTLKARWLSDLLTECRRHKVNTSEPELCNILVLRMTPIWIVAMKKSETGE